MFRALKSHLGIFCFISSLLLGLIECSELIATSDCACVGQNYAYQCTVNGGDNDLTVWSGSLVEVGCEIILFHNQYGSQTGASDECNDGAVSGRSIEAINGSYTSQLTIRVSNDLDRRTVECLLDNGMEEILINSSTLLVTKAPLPPPTRVKLIEANPTELTFTWVPPSESCPFLTYNIEAKNCGICQNSTAQSNVTCRNFTLFNVCTLKVYSVVCGGLVSTNPSNTVSANLSVPSITSILSTPYYSDGNNLLIRVETVFNIPELVNISDGIKGSVTSYNIIYSDANSDSRCGSSVIIPDASCEGGICRDLFNISSSLCSLASDIRVTIIAANVIGEVPVVNLSKAGTNKLVDVNFISSLRSIECTFLNSPMDSVTTCSANLTYGAKCDVLLGVYSSSGPTNLLRTPVINFINDVSEYCFTINASSASKTVIIEGNLNVINLGSVDIAPIVAPFVVIAIIFGALALIFALSLCYLYEPPTPVTIRFSNEDKPGSLAKMLKVFKDHNVNIIRINTHWQESDLKKTFHTRWKENFLHLMCTKDDEEFLKRQFDIKFLDASPIEVESEGDAAIHRPATATLRVYDRPGALYEILRTFTEGRNINILGLNTRSNRETTVGYKDNYVSCSCSERKLKKVQEALEKAGAMHVSQELITPTPRRLKFFVRDDVGSLVKALKVFSDLNINIISINSTALDVGRPLTHIVECRCREEDSEKLLNQLRSCATNVKECEETFNVQSENESESNDHFFVEFTLRNEVGSLVSALEVFQTLNINIIGVNTQKKDPKYFNATKKVDYQYMQIEFGVSSVDQEQELVKKLQATGMVIEAKPEESDSGPNVEVQSDNMNRKYYFAIRDEPGALAKALLVFNELKVNITRIQDLRLNPDFKYTPLTVQYKCNYVEFVSTTDQEAQLKSSLQATGLAVDVKPYHPDDLQGADNPGDHSLDIEHIAGKQSSPRPGLASKPHDI